VKVFAVDQRYRSAMVAGLTIDADPGEERQPQPWPTLL
jgi:hypothetical protein